MFNLELLTNDTNAPIIDVTVSGGSGAGGLFNLNAQSLWLRGQHDSVTNLVHMESTGNMINGNFWKHIRADFSGDYAFHLEEKTASTYVEQNRFQDILFETANNGLFNLKSVRNTIIENVFAYDNTSITNSLYVLDQGTGGNPVDNLFINCNRSTGTLTAGVYDIELNSALRTTIINCGGGAAASPTHNLHSQQAYIVYPGNATLLNRAESNSYLFDASQVNLPRIVIV